jgi:acetylornithine deacetylase/succinyl-diaminopimelate desuccinylase-like protein
VGDTARHQSVWDETGAETAELLSALIRIDTSNPPGDETRVAEFLASWLAARGVEGQLLGGLPRRLSYVARLEGRRPGPTLALMAHTDVVPADASEWTVPPFSGAIQDGYVWGRGALDVKNLVAAEALALARLAAAGADFAGTVVLIAAADEEDGDYCGARWLVQNRPDLVRCDYLLNEGGGEFIEVGGRRTYPLTVGEKGTAQFKITLHGDGGHASVPLLNRSAVAEVARAITALAQYETDLSLDFVPALLVERAVADAGLRARLLDPRTARAALADLRASAADVYQFIAPLYGITLAPTVVRAGEDAVNVHPSRAELSVDCRTLPGQDENDARREIDAALDGIDGWELTWLSVVTGNASPADTPFRTAVDRVMAHLVPGAVVAPTQCVGFTDSNWFRAAFPDCVAYGFGPFVTEDYFAVTGRFHNRDERIAVRDLGFQTTFVEGLVRELLR